MTGTNPPVNFSGDSNHGVQLASNFGHVNVSFHFSDEEKRCFETIRTSNYLARKDLNPERLPGTCNWFFDHPKYQGWKAQTPAPALLWVSADPGCGKSVLAKALVDQYDRGNVCYYFFKEDTTITRSAAHAICAILHQICDFRPVLIKYVLPLYRSNGGKLVDLFEDLWSAFVDVINDKSFGSVICIFDAVDECSDDDFKKLLQRLAALAISSTSIKILITSRPYTSIEIALFHKTGLDKNEIRLSGEAEAEQSMIEKEVGLYITSKVQEFRELRESHGIFDNAPKNVQVHLDGVKNRSYLWVSAVFNELERDVYASRGILMETINALPDNVHHAYEKILDKSPKKHILIRVLHTMLAVFRPLSVMEMNMVLSIQETSSGGPRYGDLHPVNSFGKWLRDLCGFFVNIIDNKLYFAHQTAREFLIREGGYQATVGWRGRFQTADLHTRVARVCIDYLLLMYSGSVDATFEAYSTKYWPTHCQQLEVNQSLAEKANSFLFHSNSFARWTMNVRSSYSRSLNGDRRRRSSVSSPPTPLFLACNFGWRSVIHALMSSPSIDWNQVTENQETSLAITARENHLEIAKFLVAAGVNVNAKSERGTPLHLAASKGHLEIVQLLLAAGADCKIRNDWGETTLHSAASRGHSEIVKLLLTAGVDTNTECYRRMTALHRAALKGYYEIVQLLLAAGADCEIRNGGKETALHSAASEGHSEIVKLLLNAEANINAVIGLGTTFYRDNSKSTALHLAASKGYLEIVQLLLAAGADCKIRNGGGETALHSAASEGHSEIVKLLLNAEANINAESRMGTALHRAASNGYHETVQLLWAARADCEIRNMYGEAALNSVASRWYIEIVKFLLTAGVDVNARNYDGETALHRAASNGYHEIVQLLWAAGADCEIRNMYGETALNSVASRGYIEIVKFLLTAGVDVNARNYNGESAVHLATSQGYLEIVQIILAAGADCEIRFINGRTALHSAALNGRSEIVKLLLTAGVDVNAECYLKVTALHRAASEGYLEIVQLLLAAGADLEIRNDDGETALHSVASKGHSEIVKLLLTAGVDVNAECYLKVTALHRAASKGFFEIVQLLLAAGADLKIQNNYGETALHSAASKGHAEIVKLLLTAGVDINAECYGKVTALHQAASKGYLEIVQLLLAAEADFEIRNGNRDTALHSAASKGHSEIVQLLLAARADCEI